MTSQSTRIPDRARAIERAWGPLPSGFALGWAEPASADWDDLPDEERALVSPKAKARRRQEFAMGRQAARTALTRLGLAPAPILKGANGEPIWPSGLTGSISHKNDLAVALVGPADHCPGVGLDLETVAGVIHPNLADRICHPEELSGIDSEATVKAIFSAKEAIYKAAFPTVRQTVEFRSVVIAWSGADFRAVCADRDLGRGRLARTADHLAALFFMGRG